MMLYGLTKEGTRGCVEQEGGNVTMGKERVLFSF